MHSPSAAHLSQLALLSVQSPPSSTILSNESTWIHFVADHFSPSMTGQPLWRLTGSGIAFVWRLKKRRASPLRGFTVYFQDENKKTIKTFQTTVNAEVDVKFAKAYKYVKWHTCNSFLSTFRKIVIGSRSSATWRFLLANCCMNREMSVFTTGNKMFNKYLQCYALV